MAPASWASVTSARWVTAAPPSAWMMPAVSSAAAGLISTQSTLAPSRAKVTAVALPLPQPGPIDPAPTTIATLPLSRSGIPCLHRLIESYLISNAAPCALPLSPCGRGCRAAEGSEAGEGAQTLLLNQHPSPVSLLLLLATIHPLPPWGRGSVFAPRSLGRLSP